MSLVLAPLSDPAFEQVDLCCGEFLATVDRWHVLIPVLRGDSLHEQARFGLARNDYPRLCAGSVRSIALRPLFVGGSMKAFQGIESQICFPLVLVRSVAEEAVVREDRTNVSIERDRFVSEGRR